MDTLLYTNLLTLLAVTVAKAAGVGVLVSILWRVKM